MSILRLMSLRSASCRAIRTQLLWQCTSSAFKGKGEVLAHGPPLSRQFSKKSKQKAPTDLVFVDYFCGIGMFACALHQNGYRCLGAFDCDRRAASIYQANFPDTKVHVADIRKVPKKIIPKRKTGMFMIWPVGFPCTNFSRAGKQDRDHPERKLAFHVLDYLLQVQPHRHPQIILFENVPEFMQSVEFEVLQKMLDDLGYHFSYRLYNAGRFGIAQHRQRIFMVAVKRSISEIPFEFPEEPYTWERALKTNVRQVLEDPRLPLSDPLGPLLYGFKGGVAALRWKPEFEAALENGTPDFLEPLKKSRTGIIKVGNYGKDGQMEKIYSDLGHSPTLVKSGSVFYLTPAPAMSGLERETLRLKGNIRHLHGQDHVIRKLTAREFANLQGVPNDMVLDQHRSVVYEHVGNGVVVPVVDWIVKAIGEQFLSVDKPGAVQKGDVVKHDQGATLAGEAKLLRDQLQKDLERFKEAQEREIDDFVERIGKLKIK